MLSTFLLVRPSIYEEFVANTLMANVLGFAIMFYGYDQGVMSLVNLNPDYQKRMGIFPTDGTRSVPRYFEFR